MDDQSCHEHSLLYRSWHNVSSSIGCSSTRNLDAELEQSENLGVAIDNPRKELNADPSQASEMKLIKVDSTLSC